MLLLELRCFERAHYVSETSALNLKSKASSLKLHGPQAGDGSRLDLDEMEWARARTLVKPDDQLNLSEAVSTEQGRAGYRRHTDPTPFNDATFKRASWAGPGVI